MISYRIIMSADEHDESGLEGHGDESARFSRELADNILRAVLDKKRLLMK